MDDVSAIVVAAITGICGIIGILITQRAARKRTGAMVPSPQEEIAGLMGTGQVAPMDVLMVIQRDIKENRQLTRENVEKVVDSLMDIKHFIRDLKQEQRDQFDDLERRLTR